MKIEEIKIEKLIPYEFNNKIHDETQVNRIANSIKEFGFKNPILIDKNNVIIAGHGRLEGAKKLGLKKVPVIIADDLSEEQVKKFRILDNRLNESERDLENLQIELSTMPDLNIGDLEIDINTEFDDLFPEAEEEKEKIEEYETQEPIQEAKIVRGGDCFQLGRHRLMCGDSTDEKDVGKLMDGELVDLVFTDPPYGVSYAEKNKFLNSVGNGQRLTDAIQNDSKTPEEMQEFREKAFANIEKYSKDCMSYYITAPQGGELLLLSTSLINTGLQLRHTLIWNKNNHVLGRCDYNYKHEPILYGRKTKGTHKFYGKGEFQTSVRDIPKPLNSDLHPTMKPVRLVVNCILNNTQKGDLVLDLFGGSGTTLIACEETGRKCYMMEYEPKYIETIIRRFHEVNPDAEIKCVNREININEILSDEK